MSDKGDYGVNEKSDPTQNTIRLMDTAVNGLTALFASEMRRVDDELGMLRTAPSDESSACDAYIEECRAWGKAEKAKIGLGTG